MGGNFGTTLSEMIIEEISAQTSSFDFAVVEILLIKWDFPLGLLKVGVILNLTPDHLARHKTMDVYAQMKNCIFAAQSKDDFACSLSKSNVAPNNPNLNPFFLTRTNEPIEWWIHIHRYIVQENTDNLCR